MGLRVSAHEEKIRLDLEEHGVNSYYDFQKTKQVVKDLIIKLEKEDESTRVS